MAAVRGTEIFPEKARDGDRVSRIRRSGELVRQDGRMREGRVPVKSGGDVSSLYQAAGERESLFDGVREVKRARTFWEKRTQRLLFCIGKKIFQNENTNLRKEWIFT